MATAFQHMGRGAALPPLALIAQAIPRLSRHDLAALTERLIDRLDEVDPDPDLEPDDDDQCSAGEDMGAQVAEHWQHGRAYDPYGSDDELSDHPPLWPTGPDYE